MLLTIQGISRRLANEKSYTGDIGQDAEVFAYGIKILLLNTTALAGIILLAWLLGTLKSTVIIWAASYSLRIFSGGRHQSGPVQCWITTVAVFIILGCLSTVIAPLISEYVLLISTLGLVFALFNVIAYAPVTIANKQFAPQKQIKLKMAAVAVVVFWGTVALAPFQAVFSQPVVPLAIMMGLIVQSCSISTFGYSKIFKRFHRLRMSAIKGGTESSNNHVK